ncbi:uncharacterized protein LOC143567473 [Bidens hawaiensis]|uniref:uncharacterized protein LOC143567473 n=1 Tax=Bidens hawaiensis TaxID=980011 RepID=UPI0040497A7E
MTDWVHYKMSKTLRQDNVVVVRRSISGDGRGFKYSRFESGAAGFVDYDKEAEAVLPNLNHLFSSREELEEWAKRRGRDHGCVVVVQRSRTNSVDLACNRGGKPKLTATVRRTDNIKKGSLFKLKGRYDRGGDFWKLQVVIQTHIHEPFVFKESHAYLRRMSDEEADMIARLHMDGLKTQKYFTLLRNRFHRTCIIEKDTKNLIEKLKKENKVFENFLNDNGSVYYTRENPSTNRTDDVFFCHDTTFKMWRALPNLLLIDTTYNTKMYKWPFVQYIGVISTSKSLCITHETIFRSSHHIKYDMSVGLVEVDVSHDNGNVANAGVLICMMM